MTTKRKSSAAAKQKAKIIVKRCRYLLDDSSPCLNDVTGTSDFCEKHGNQFTSDLAVYKMIGDHFRQDVREFWVKSNFYLLVHAALLSVFVSTTNKTSPYYIITDIILGVLGELLAIIWFLVARGSILWLRTWRAKMIEIDEVIDRHHFYMNVESFATRSPLMSPSNVTQYLPLVFSIVWFILLVFIFIYYNNLI